MTFKGMVKFATGCLLVALALNHCSSHNGFWDSPRTGQISRLLSPYNKVKRVVSVEESWRDNKIYSSDMTGYNPLVIRKVVFDDGSETTLRYRTLAWQPFRRWIRGEEFNPRPGERYEVNRKTNELVNRSTIHELFFNQDR